MRTRHALATLHPAVASRLVAAARLALAVAVLACTSAQAQDANLEFAVKATYLYKFADYVDWPEGTFRAPADPLVICIVGSDGVAQLVEAAVAGHTTLDGRAVVARRVAMPLRDAGCHVLYIATRQDAATLEALRATRGLPVLTVTDTRNGDAVRGIIAFVIVDNRVRFDIDLAAAAQNHLAISSKLLNLAARVRPAP
ncbi:MAG TPA: YfiR family protein [Casimicrobiaceae bacterium]|nr:YfiR family protein [Casimicrobiaceae bacterium]